MSDKIIILADADIVRYRGIPLGFLKEEYGDDVPEPFDYVHPFLFVASGSQDVLLYPLLGTPRNWFDEIIPLQTIALVSILSGKKIKDYSDVFRESLMVNPENKEELMKVASGYTTLMQMERILERISLDKAEANPHVLGEYMRDAAFLGLLSEYMDRNMVNLLSYLREKDVPENVLWELKDIESFMARMSNFFNTKLAQSFYHSYNGYLINGVLGGRRGNRETWRMYMEERMKAAREMIEEAKSQTERLAGIIEKVSSIPQEKQLEMTL